eukprot:CAMPEP_0198354596 /NCGR_PEP_ID=MMETSP1450-20131203/115922_1 /TAXON_ID=753684 ORGANISM="Madagascaria erythrocladiodes, Strain CCMP3234" /NCGR_SAMPLE_ID=MMETSP1450 /ASSEMBLY_ACC=CAM_ASM_001115 /LENGTH=75 /DNA_ID=CAMNT_0044060887 /DNA_START=7 /DNA_END=231 /DNA_ORIENTATION=+
MPSFVCDGCQDTCTKGKIAAHRRRCGDAHVMSCADCNETFYGDEVIKHTSCVTEKEKYAGKYLAKAAKQRQQKQQ